MRVRARSSFQLLLAVFLLAVASGCARTPKPTHVVRLAVLNGVLEDEAAQTQTTVTGWWMLSRDRFENGNAGILLGEVLAKEYEKIPGVQVFSRTDLMSYMAQKERLIGARIRNSIPRSAASCSNRRTRSISASPSTSITCSPRPTSRRCCAVRSFSATCPAPIMRRSAWSWIREYSSDLVLRPW
ncbi:MAG: hypothetical protein HC927_06860 [Deltaproteobacteria bacterium]|nr:hypothetical protein [Deltaproteobacteria bacterium]